MNLSEERERIDWREHESLSTVAARWSLAVAAAVLFFAMLVANWARGAEPKTQLIPTKIEPAWLIYRPAGYQNGRGIMQDVLSRCDARTRQTMYDADSETWTHEGTHGLNSIIRNKMGGTSTVNAFYVGDGKCLVLKEPKLRLSWVRQYVKTKHPTPTLAWSSWENEPLYLCDELSAYMNGLQHAKETKRQSHGSHIFTPAMLDWCDALVVAIERHDPQYSDMAGLKTYIAYQRARYQELAK